MVLTAGTRLAHYEILEPVGRGAMGEVYRARDSALGRVVAIKVLPPEMAADPRRLRRFEQEARAASALNHPDIVTIYEIGEHEGTPFIAMEYVEGITLREMLSQGPLPNDELIRYARQMAEGLAKAHQAGIVHRDLKPENILISRDGYAKILDFGLVKLLPEGDVGSQVPTLAKETTPGAILGTVGYMSPEQAKGEPADFRSDQFSLGAIFYEMATGKRAFRRDTPAQTLTAIIEDQPELVALANPNVVATTARVIERCLRKDPNERYASTLDMARDIHREEPAVPAQPSARHSLPALAVVGTLAIVLVMLGLFIPGIRQWLAGGSGAPHIESIAVLPLENLSGDPEQEYFAEGMTEALIMELSRIRALRVISRTSAMRYKDTDKSLPEIARELKVDAVVEGSVLRAGDRVRVTTELIDAAADRHLWAESYDRDLHDILALQSDVARAVAREVHVVLTTTEESRLAEARPVDPGAYEAYLRGRYHLNRFTEEEIEEAIAYFESALAREPHYAAAYAGLADCYNWLGTAFVGRPPAEFRPKAIAAAVRALEFDDNLAEAHAALGWAKFTEWDWSGAEPAFQRAIELSPNDEEAHRLYGYYLASRRRFDEAVAEARKAVAVDPVSVFAQTALGHMFLFAGCYDAAIGELQKALDLDLSFPFAWQLLGTAYLHKSMFEEARAALEKATALSRRSPTAVAGLGCAYAGEGQTRRARELMRELTELSRDVYVPPASLAWLSSCLGDNNRAVEWVEKAFDERSLGGLGYLAWWPEGHPLRSDPRFQALLRRMHLPPSRESGSACRAP
jgi:TolB-like protein/Tfp pilus assembly protein PilF/tRNA A-37 threonylcarbamoyl transferase component Bud32